MTKIIYVINILLVVATFASYAAPYIHPKLSWIFAFFGLFFPLFLAANALYIIFWLFVKPSHAILSALCLLAGFNYIVSFIGFHSPSLPENTENIIRAATYNISNASFLDVIKEGTQKENSQKFLETMENFDSIDVLCFQEVRDYAAKLLDKKFPNHYHHVSEKSSVILSKHRILKKGVIDFGTRTNSCVWADIRFKKDTIRVYSFHLKSNQISKNADKVTQDIQNNEKLNWYDIKGMFSKFRRYHKDRVKQVEMIAAHLNQCPHPYILGGDLNDPAQSYTYRVISENSTDAFKIRGKGIGTTYAGNIPLLRIDYMFYSNEFECISYDSPTYKISDHYPVIVELIAKR